MLYRMNKKGAELSINVIIVAVLGLLILVVLIFIVSGKLGDFRAGANACEGGVVQPIATQCNGPSFQVTVNGEKLECCLPPS